MKARNKHSLTRYRVRSFFGLLIFALPLVILAVGLLVTAQLLPVDKLDALEKVFISLASGMLALASAYVGAALQNHREREKELHQTRRQRTQPYRDYLIQLMNIGQRTDLVKGFTKSKALDDILVVDITKEDRDRMLKDLPPIRHLSAIEDTTCREHVDIAIELGIQYCLRTGNDRPKSEEVQKAYLVALSELDYYENFL